MPTLGDINKLLHNKRILAYKLLSNIRKTEVRIQFSMQNMTFYKNKIKIH